MSRARSVADLGNQSLNLSVSDGALKVGAGATVENTGESQFAGIVTATKFVGDGSGLTGVTGTGSGVVVKNSGSPVGTPYLLALSLLLVEQVVGILYP